MPDSIPGPKSACLNLDFPRRFKQDPLNTAALLQREFGDIVKISLGPVD
ncbi:MAG: hypothetical protein K2Z81_11745 [Cyanobacteria bacterium]|nr:hypothetical protein [Cyanobacteriota bacterium]